MSTRVAPLVDDIYPDSDGKPLAETGIHVDSLLSLFGRLKYYFRPRHDIYVAGNMFLYYQEGDPKKRCAPDVQVSKGVIHGNIERRSFKTWVEKTVPCCIIEVTSKKTAKQDLKVKKPLYKKLGVREYFLYDPLDEYLPNQFIGFRLEGKKYVRLKRDKKDGSIISEELGMQMVPAGYHLDLVDLQTGERLLWINDYAEKLDDYADKMAESDRQLNEKSRQVDEQNRQLEEERRRIAALEAELSRLKASQSVGSASSHES